MKIMELWEKIKHWCWCYSNELIIIISNLLIIAGAIAFKFAYAKYVITLLKN